MDDREIIQWLWHYGYFYLTEVDKDDLDGLRLTDQIVIDAIAKAQAFVGQDLDVHTAEIYGRRSDPDGVLGPATIAYFQTPRCAYPDFGPEVQRATGGGSWPAGCHESWPSNHAVGIRVDRQRMPSRLQPIFDDVIARVTRAYADIGMVLIWGESKVNIDFAFEPLRGATIGLAIVPSGARCNTHIWCKYDPSYQPSDLANQWCRLIAHELGHNMGMGHSRGGIMNPSIVSGVFTDTAWRGDPSYPLLRRYFGGDPVTPKPKPDEPDEPSPPQGKIVIRGEFWAELEDGTKTAVSIPTPKPSI